jgi:uncharacterized protein (UPF0262 family)
MTEPDRERESTSRIVDIQLDETSIVRWSPEVEHERNVAVFDLLEGNHFEIPDDFACPYSLELSLHQATLVVDIRNKDAGAHTEIRLPMRPFRRLIKDYFLICDSYFEAIKGATPSRIEAIDMARRGLHNEGADLLRDALAPRVHMDGVTGRRLFTLVCVLHIRG